MGLESSSVFKHKEYGDSFGRKHYGRRMMWMYHGSRFVSIQTHNRVIELRFKGEFYNLLMQPSEQPTKKITLVDYIKNHASFQKLTPDKIEIFRRYVELNPKGLHLKQVRAISRSFTERCPPELLTQIITKIMADFSEFVQNQKRVDDSKMRRLSELTSNWQKGRQQRWKESLVEFHERERERSRDSSYRL